jgi:hypothetical protein
MPENDPPKLRVGSVLCRPCWATPALLGTQGQVFLKARRSKHRRRLGGEANRELRGGGEEPHGSDWELNLQWVAR